MRLADKFCVLKMLTLAASLNALATLSCQAASVSNDSNKPNIVLIVADDLGYSDLGAFGSEIATPHLDALADSGVQLTNFHAAPTCSPTRSMLLTGTDNHIAGVGTMAETILPEQKGKTGYEGYLTDRVVTFPTLLRESGYHTFMAGKWHLGKTPELSPAARGFERSFALLDGSAHHFTQGGVTPMRPKATYRQDGKEIDLPKSFKYSTDFYTDQLISDIATRKDNKPFFGYLAYTAPHWPLQVPEAYLQRYKGVYDKGYKAIAEARLQRLKDKGIIAKDVVSNPGPGLWPVWEDLSATERALEVRRMEIYAAMVTNMDDNVGKLVTYLKDTGEYDNTIFVFLSDNGAEGSGPEDITPVNPKWIRENFDNSLGNIGKQGSFASYGPRWALVSSTPFRMYKTSTYEGGIRTPAFISGPGMRSGEISDTYVSVKDIAPTFLEVASAKQPADINPNAAKIEGTSALGFLRNSKKSVHNPDDVQCTELFGRVALFKGQWKLAFSNKPWGTGEFELFDMQRDPSEINDLSDEQPQVKTELLKQWSTCQKRNGILWNPQLADKLHYGNEVKKYQTAKDTSQ